MKSALAFAILLALLFAYTAHGSSSQPDPRSYDLDGDGSISILDIAIVASHFLEVVGTPDACYRWQTYDPTVTGYSVGLVVPSGHPVFSGPVTLRPCP